MGMIRITDWLIFYIIIILYTERCNNIHILSAKDSIDKIYIPIYIYINGMNQTYIYACHILTADMCIACYCFKGTKILIWSPLLSLNYLDFPENFK